MIIKAMNHALNEIVREILVDNVKPIDEFANEANSDLADTIRAGGVEICNIDFSEYLNNEFVKKNHTFVWLEADSYKEPYVKVITYAGLNYVQYAGMLYGIGV